MPDSAGVQREAREVAIKAGAARLAIGAWGANDTQRTVMAREVWDAGVAALAEAGIEVGCWEQFGWQERDGSRTYDYFNPHPVIRDRCVPVYRRVEGGATGEQTDSLRVGDHLLTDSELVRRRPSKEDAQ